MRVLAGLLDETKCFEVVRQMERPQGVECPHCAGTTVSQQGRDARQPEHQDDRCWHYSLPRLHTMKFPTSHVPSRIAAVPVGWLLCATLLSGLQGCSMTSRMFDTHASTDTVRNVPPPPVLVSDAPAASGAGAILAAAPAEPDRSAAVAPAAPPAAPPATPPGAFVNERAAAIAARGPVSVRPTVAATSDDTALLPGNADLPKGRWAARIGLFGVEANAYRQAATLRDAVASHPDLPAEQRVVRVVKTGERYIVLLGDLADAQSARQLVSKVQQILHQDAIIYTR
jgi:hypothetical protein